MREDLDKALVKDFPNLYKDRYGSMRSTSMCWGFSCDDGWEPLIRDLSAKLEKLILDMPENERVCASQVKEKWGTLSFYMTGETDEMFELIREAERQSATTCELCGSAGTLKNLSGWYRTVCDEHNSN